MSLWTVLLLVAFAAMIVSHMRGGGCGAHGHGHRGPDEPADPPGPSTR